MIYVQLCGENFTTVVPQLIDLQNRQNKLVENLKRNHFNRMKAATQIDNCFDSFSVGKLFQQSQHRKNLFDSEMFQLLLPNQCIFMLYITDNTLCSGLRSIESLSTQNHRN